MELLATGSVVLKDLSGLELRTELIAVAIHLIDDRLSTLVIEVAERATEEGRESDAEDSANVAYSILRNKMEHDILRIKYVEKRPAHAKSVDSSVS